MKKKKHISGRLPASQFIMLFGLLYGFAIGLGNLISTMMLQSNIDISWAYLYPAITVFPVLLGYIVQSIVLKYQFGWSALKWFIASSIGLLLMFLMNVAQFTVLTNFVSPFAIDWAFRRLAMILLGITQFFVLRQYIKQAWYWIIAIGIISITNAPLYSLLYRAIGPEIIFAGIGSSLLMASLASIQGIILGMVMTMIVRLSNQSSRQQIDMDAEHDRNTAHLEEDASDTIEYSDDESLATLQHQARTGD